MLRAVLDANVLASALIRPQGPPGQIVTRLLENRAFELVASAPIFEELRRCLAYPRVHRYITATDEEVSLWVAAIELIADPTEGALNVRAVTDDPDDDKYLVAAMEGRAQFIVSGDAHLLGLGEYEGVRVVTARALLQLLKG